MLTCMCECFESLTHSYIVVPIVKSNYCKSGRTLTWASAGTTHTHNDNTGNGNNNCNNNMKKDNTQVRKFWLTTILHSHRRDIWKMHLLWHRRREKDSDSLSFHVLFKNSRWFLICMHPVYRLSYLIRLSISSCACFLQAICLSVCLHVWQSLHLCPSQSLWRLNNEENDCAFHSTHLSLTLLEGGGDSLGCRGRRLCGSGLLASGGVLELPHQTKRAHPLYVLLYKPTEEHSNTHVHTVRVPASSLGRVLLIHLLMMRKGGGG